MKVYVYVCTSKKCSKKGIEMATSTTPADSRAQTGRAVTCDYCGRTCFLRRVEDLPEPG